MPEFIVREMMPKTKLQTPPVEAYITIGPASAPGNRVVAACFSVDGVSGAEYARRLAAAPDLLEACKAALKDYTQFIPSANAIPTILRAAIAKAEGGAA